jgi:hypothetical protein
MKTKQQKQQDALVKLTARIGERQSRGLFPTFSQKMEYNALNKALGQPHHEIKLSEPKIADDTAALKRSLLSLQGDFTYLFGRHFFIETKIGNFVWSDPDYGGDNRMIKFDGSWDEYRRTNQIDFGREKGIHDISGYCGDEFTVVVE